MKVTISQGDRGCGKEDCGGRGNRTGRKRTPHKDRGPQEEYADTRDSAKRCPIYPQGQEKPQMLWLSLGCAPHPQLGLDCREGDASIVANTPTLLCETDSQFSPPPIKLTNHPPSQAQRGRRGLPAPKPTGNSAQKEREESFKRPWNSCQSTHWRRRQSQQGSGSSLAILCAKS